mgnify:CR=1 FL=1
MLTLCGFSASNYYNKVKLALLEKGVPFEEELAWVGETDKAASPLGKVPYLKTDAGAMSESTVILEYLEEAFPQHPLMPADAFAAAKVRELVAEYGLTVQDVFPGRGAKTSVTKSVSKVAAKYRDPATGQTWTGRGKAPKWIEGLDRSPFVIG